MARLGLLLWDWVCFLGSGLSLSLRLPSALPGPWGPQISVVAFIVSDGLRGLGQTTIGVSGSYCHIQGPSLPLFWPGSELLALG